MAELIYYVGTMDCGKSTLALQTDHNHASRGRSGLVFTKFDRAGESVLSSRLGLEVPAIEVSDGLNLRRFVEIAQLVDELAIDVFAFGILTDFRTKLFPGSARLLELADRVQYLQVEALCWCGSRALHNARTINGEMTTDGDQVMVGDVSSSTEVSYEVLCRRHYRAQLTSKRANNAHLSREPLPFDAE